ncbi:GlcNAc transferase [Tieghemostelium lacteum]|uniref:GlcNAc transferase n=1 Tax=Tieghemostelium lacteum TaxID=361077 RepID=A0A152A166_TIELA|nr:GlcNAc transferase [Tieghemostelium lacteum]|eukprot:KYQ99959.1 GlcNAc transferase [Tieghemostelium lacteum]
MHYSEAKGPCLARSLTQTLFDNEKYFLQIDSHMRFIKNWDTELIRQLSQCPNPSKSILTCYPMGYTLPNEIPTYKYPMLLVATHFSDKDSILRFSGKIVQNCNYKQPILSRFWVSGFSFSHSSVIKDTPYDPSLDYLFFGEEISMTVRLWTNGYDFYSPTQSIVFHLWKRDYRPNFRENQKEIDQLKLKEQLEKQSQLKVLNLLEGALSSDCKYGNGEQRTLEEYQKFSGINFKSKIIDSSAKLGGYSESFFMNEIMELVIKSKVGL